MFDNRIQDMWVVNPNIIGKEVLFYGINEEIYSLYKSLVRTGLIRLLGVYDNGNLEGGGVMWENIKILSRKELLSLNKEDVVVIISTKQVNEFQEIARDLLDNSFTNIISRVWPSVPKQYNIESSRTIIKAQESNIKFLYSLLEDSKSKKVMENILRYRITNEISFIKEIRETSYKQYFPNEDFFKPETEEVFIDAGSLDGSTIKDFVEWTKKKYKYAIGFEPSDEDKVIVDEMLQHWGYNAECVLAGLYNKSGKMNFEKLGLGWSAITETGSMSIDVVTLDEFMKERTEKITFIKMDIEGSELEALEGAKEVIQKSHPKLAICLYHKFDDLWKIPLWIHERFPKYRFWMRHHSITDNETVLYAVWKD